MHQVRRRSNYEYSEAEIHHDTGGDMRALSLASPLPSRRAGCTAANITAAGVTSMTAQPAGGMERSEGTMRARSNDAVESRPSTTPTATTASPTTTTAKPTTPATKATTTAHATGQPNASCEDTPNQPGHSISAPGSAFNPDGVAGTHYAGEQPQNSVKPGRACPSMTLPARVHSTEAVNLPDRESAARAPRSLFQRFFQI